MKPLSGVFPVTAAWLLLLVASCSHTQEYYLKQGDALVRKGDSSGAIAQYELALNAGKPNHRHYQVIADIHAGQGNLDKAIDFYLKAAEVLKNDAMIISEQARRTPDPAEQEKLLYLLEERINPYNSQVHFKLGMLYIEKGDHATAVIALELALQRHESNLRARMELARLMERKGDTEAAMKEWRRFLKDAEKASKEDKGLYSIGEAEVVTARRQLEKLALARAGATETDKEPEK